MKADELRRRFAKRPSCFGQYEEHREGDGCLVCASFGECLEESAGEAEEPDPEIVEAQCGHCRHFQLEIDGGPVGHCTGHGKAVFSADTPCPTFHPADVPPMLRADARCKDCAHLQFDGHALLKFCELRSMDRHGDDRACDRFNPREPKHAAGQTPINLPGCFATYNPGRTDGKDCTDCEFSRQCEGVRRRAFEHPPPKRVIKFDRGELDDEAIERVREFVEQQRRGMSDALVVPKGMLAEPIPPVSAPEPEPDKEPREETAMFKSRAGDESYVVPAIALTSRAQGTAHKIASYACGDYPDPAVLQLANYAIRCLAATSDSVDAAAQRLDVVVQRQVPATTSQPHRQRQVVSILASVIKTRAL